MWPLKEKGGMKGLHGHYDEETLQAEPWVFSPLQTYLLFGAVFGLVYHSLN